MRDNLNLGLRGDYRITLKQGKETILQTPWEHNEIIANAPIILSRLLAGQPFQLDRVVLKNAGVLVAVGEVISTTHPSFEETTFKVVFDYDSFNSNIDEMQLVSSYGGTFSVVTNLAITKTNEQSMGIEWKIKVGINSPLWVPDAVIYGLGSLPIFPPSRISTVGGKDYLTP